MRRLRSVRRVTCLVCRRKFICCFTNSNLGKRRLREVSWVDLGSTGRQGGSGLGKLWHGIIRDVFPCMDCCVYREVMYLNR